MTNRNAQLEAIATAATLAATASNEYEYEYWDAKRTQLEAAAAPPLSPEEKAMISPARKSRLRRP